MCPLLISSRLVARLGQIFGREGRAVNAIAPGARTNRHDRIADALGLGANEILFMQEADTHRVDERIALVRRIENDLAGDRWNTDAIAVVADSLHDSGEEIPHARIVEGAKPERVEHRDRTRSHREYVAQNSANSRCGSLVRLDRRGMIMRLDLERHCQTVADRYHASVLARTLKHVGGGGRKCLQSWARMLVGAVLAPQRAHDSQLGKCRRASKHSHQPLEFLLRQAVLRDERGSNDRIAGSSLHCGHVRPPLW